MKTLTGKWTFLPTLIAGYYLFLILAFYPTQVTASEDTKRLGLLLNTLPNLPALLAPSLLPDAPPFSLHVVNLRGAERAGQTPSPESLQALIELDKESFAKWSAALSRIVAFNIAQEVGSEVLIRNAIPGIRSVFRTLPVLLGVDWFAIDQLTFFSIPPYSITVALGDGLNASSDAITAAMNTGGFSQRETHGLTEWYRFEDLEQRLDQAVTLDAMGRRPLDPFGISTGHAVRLLWTPGRVAGANASVFSEMIAATWVGAMPSLGAAADYRTALLAVSQDKGQWVQTLVTNRRFLPADMAVGHLGPYSSEAKRADYIQKLAERDPSAVPPYELMVLADCQEGSNEVTLLGLVYDTREAAETAAATLPPLFDAYAPRLYQQRLLEAERLERSSHVFVDAPDGPFVALIKLHRRVSSESTTVKPGKIYRVLSEAMAIGDIDPLVILDQ